MKKIVSGLTSLILALLFTFNCYAQAGSQLYYAQKLYINSLNGYSILIPEGVKLRLNGSENIYNENIISLVDKNRMVSAAITCDKLDSSSIKAMRQYFDDYISDDNSLFEKYVQHANTFIDSLENYYKKYYLFGDSISDYSESNLKIWGKFSEKIYGVSSTITLYNVINTKKSRSIEETHINILVPVSTNFTIYSINFTVKAGNLNQEAISTMINIIKAIRISNLDYQTSSLKALENINLINKINSGIYPDMDKSDISYTELVDTEGGYKIKYPSTFIPYKQNNISDLFNYKSYRINPHQQFSIQVEPLHENNSTVEGKVQLIKEINRDSIKMVNEGSLSSSGKQLHYLMYELTDSNNVTTYIWDFFAVNNTRLYNIKLSSMFIKPTLKQYIEFMKIVYSLDFEVEPFAAFSLMKMPETEFTSYISSPDGYEFSYPENWIITPSNDSDQNSKTITVKNPDFSSALNIMVSESSLKPDSNVNDILKLTDTQKLNEYIEEYPAPYSDKIITTLAQHYNIKNGNVYFYRLVNYLDDSNRLKYCYSVDIIQENKVSSLFVSVSEYITEDGQISYEEINEGINKIISSFDLKQQA